MYLFSVWSVDVRCWVRYRRCRSLAGAQLVKVVPHAFTGANAVVPLERSTVDGEPLVSFSFRKLRFLWDAQAGAFRKLEYPTKVRGGGQRRRERLLCLHYSYGGAGMRCREAACGAGAAPCAAAACAAAATGPALQGQLWLIISKSTATDTVPPSTPSPPPPAVQRTFAQYRASSGYGRDAAVCAALERWGPNRFEVPVPTFLELLREQLLAPFFCFQVFCVALWALDEYW